MKNLHFCLSPHQRRRLALPPPPLCSLITAVKTDTRDSSGHVPSLNSQQPSAGMGAVHLLWGSACSLQNTGEGPLA